MAKKQKRVGEDVGKPSGNQGAINNKCLILYLASKNKLSAGTLSGILGVSRQMVHRYLNELERDFFIYRDSRGIIYLPESGVLPNELAIRREVWLSLGEPLAEKLKLVVYRQMELLQWLA